MKSLDLNTNLLSEEGISCVERHYIAVLKYLLLPYPYIYYKSFVPAETCIFDFIQNKSTYLDYRGIERVFITGKKLGLLGISFNSDNKGEIYKVAEVSIKNKLPILVFIDHKALNNDKKLDFWRDNHVVSIIGCTKEGFLILDDRPLRKYEISFSQFSKVYLYQYACFEKNTSNISYKNTINRVFEDIYLIPIRKISGISHITKDNAIYLRNSMAILKISRLRIKIFFSYFSEYANDLNNIIFILEKQIKKINMLFMLFELFRIRKNFCEKTIDLSELFDLDRLLKKEVEKVYEKFYCRKSNSSFDGAKPFE